MVADNRPDRAPGRQGGCGEGRNSYSGAASKTINKFRRSAILILI